MPTLIRFTITAAVLAAISATVFAVQGRSEAGTIAAAPTPAGTPPTQATPTPTTTPGTPVHVNPDPTHPSGDLIDVSIAKQRLTAWRDGRVIFRFVISTGRPGYETPVGHYKITDKYVNEWSRRWKVWMPFAMRWHDGYFIHQLAHYPGSRVNLGASKLGKADSHGCVRVNVGDAERLFDWTAAGTPVWVR